MTIEERRQDSVSGASSGADARARMLDKIRRAQPAAKPLPTVPTFPVLDARSRQERFAQALDTMGGSALAIDAIGGLAALPNWLSERFGAKASIASAAPEVQGTIALDATIPPTQYETLDVGVVRARFGICETGSVWLSETEYIVNAIGYLAQHLVVLLDSDSLEDGVQHAYRRDDFKTAKYCVLVTGPSATADIEGVMIRGAQGVRSLTVIWCDKN